MALDRITYPVTEVTKEFTQLANLFYFDRFSAVVNTRGTIVTPTMTLEDTVVTLPTFSTTARAEIEIAIDLIGAFAQFELSPVANIQWYATELTVRPLVLGVGLLPRGARQQFPGRSSDLSSFMLFELKPFSVPVDARLSCIITKRVYIDIVTGAETVTPVLLFTDGTSQTLPAIAHPTRAVAELSLLAAERVVAVRLDGDFTNSSIVVYDVEMDMYLPGNVALGAA